MSLAVNIKQRITTKCALMCSYNCHSTQPLFP